VLRLGRLVSGEMAVQEKHFVLFTVAKTPKITEIRNFLNFDAIFKKTVKYTGCPTTKDID